MFSGYAPQYRKLIFKNHKKVSDELRYKRNVIIIDTFIPIFSDIN